MQVRFSDIYSHKSKVKLSLHQAVEDPHVLDNRFIDGGEVVRLTRQQRFTSEEDFWYSVLLQAEYNPMAVVRLEGLDKLKESNELIEN
jgi:hypothetical protein